MTKELKLDRKLASKHFFEFKNIGCFSLLILFVIIPAVVKFRWYEIIGVLIWLFISYGIGFINGWDSKEDK